MADAKYVNKPGGVIVHLDDGTATNLTYGDKVPDNLADYVDASTFSDGRKRKPDADELAIADAQRRAALAEGGQVNSSSSPVPGNYSELDEDARVQLVQSLGRYPEQQAAILLHEMVFGQKSQKVIDAAGDYAQKSAGIQQEALTDTVTDQTENIADTPSVVPLGDAETAVTRTQSGLDPAVEKAQIAALEGKGDGQTATPPPSA